MSNRFDYIAYDQKSFDQQALIKGLCIDLEAAINAIGTDAASARERALALTQLEVVYARCGRAIRDEQRSSGSVQLQEGRGNE